MSQTSQVSQSVDKKSIRDLFPQIDTSLSMKEKISLTVELHDANYFIDAEQNTFSAIKKNIMPKKEILKY